VEVAVGVAVFVAVGVSVAVAVGNGVKVKVGVKVMVAVGVAVASHAFKVCGNWQAARKNTIMPATKTKKITRGEDTNISIVPSTNFLSPAHASFYLNTFGLTCRQASLSVAIS